MLESLQATMTVEPCRAEKDMMEAADAILDKLTVVHN